MKQIENQEVRLEIIKNSGVHLYVKREDLIHPYISGNKYRKLKYNLLEAEKQKKSTLLTFGGAYSNHISAVAYAGYEFGFKTIGVIRGDELAENLEKILSENPTLRQARRHGMQFYFVSRSAYREKHTPEFITNLREKFGKFYLVPEGGTNELAVKGCEEILDERDQIFDYVCCAIGTGGTISGLINSATENQQILGFPALKGNFLQKEIERYTIKSENWRLINSYHFGGFAKINSELVRFINGFKEETGIALDPIYTGKMLFGIVDMIRNGYFKKGSRILAIHTGGLQGIEGMNQRLVKKGLPTLTQ